MQLVTYNIHFGLGRDGRVDLDRIAEAVAGGDVVALQEVDRHWPRSGMVDQVRGLAERLPGHYWVFGPTIDLASPLSRPGPHGALRRQFGNMILARWPILASRNLLLPRGPRATRTMQRGVLEAIVATPGGALRVYTTHLDYRAPRTRALQFRAICDLIDGAVDDGGAWSGSHPSDGGWVLGDEPEIPTAAIVLGDLNAAPTDPEWATSFANRGLVDVWELVDGAAEARTKPDHGRIDHCLVTPDLAAEVRDAWIDVGATGSDHLPLWVKLDR